MSADVQVGSARERGELDRKVERPVAAQEPRAPARDAGRLGAERAGKLALEVSEIKGYLAPYNERVDLIVDGRRQERLAGPLGTMSSA
jgi:hypothetical protein